MSRTRTAHALYVLVAYGVTWLLWLPVLLASYGLPSFSNPYVPSWFTDFVDLKASTPAHWLVLSGGVLGPAFGALAAWRYRSGVGGRAAARYLFDVRRGDWLGWLTALLPIGYFAAGSIVIFTLTGMTFGSEVGPGAFVSLLLTGCVLVIGEELGWRGTQLPLLQEDHSAVRASFVVAITWACWHLPLLLMWNAAPGRPLAPAALALIPYVLLTIPMSIMHTFAFNTARGLVLVSILLHGLHNHLNAVLVPNPGADEALARAGALADPVLLGLFWLIAIILWRAFGGGDLSPRTKVTASAILASGGPHV